MEIPIKEIISNITSEKNTDQIVNFLGKKGFDKPKTAFSTLKTVLSGLQKHSNDKNCLVTFLEILLQQSHPEPTLKQCHILWEDMEDPLSIFPQKSFPPLLRFITASPYALTLLKKHPHWWTFLNNQSLLCKTSTLVDYQNRLQTFAKKENLETPDLLRRFHAREFLRIGLQEIEEKKPVHETALELSLLAEVIAQEALDFSLEENKNKWGHVEKNAKGYFVFGMGKLGGRELNFSSDIDVICFYRTDQGKVISQKEITPHEYYTRLTERWVKTLNEITAEGFAYRVDLRLRPEGTRGPLVNSLRGGEIYYETWGTLWERAAFLKARPICGDIPLGMKFFRSLEPFIYKRHIDFRVIEEIKKLKEKISQEQRERNRLRSPENASIDIKLDEGGIREIEFFVQALQLIHGGREFLLRSGNTLTTIKNLELLRIIKSKEAKMLSDAYLFFRRLEHLIQFHDNQQTHQIPSNPIWKKQLATLLGFSKVETFESVVDKHRQKVHGLFEDLLSEGPTSSSSSAMPLLPSQQMPEILSLLHEYSGDQDPQTKSLLESIASLLAKELERLPDWRKYLRPLETLFRQIGKKHDYYELWIKDKGIVEKLFLIFSQSEFLSEILNQNFWLLKDLDKKSLVSNKKALEKKLQTSLSKSRDRGEALDNLRAFRHEHLFHIGLADLSGFTKPSEIQMQLSHLADTCIEEGAHWVLKELHERYGEAKLEDQDQLVDVAIIGLGSLGGEELNYTSDLDLIFIYSGTGETKGEKKISNQEFFTLFAQRLISFLSTVTNTGRAYNVDTRLRPSGRAGTLVTSHQAFFNYHQKQSQLWEIQSLLRGRMIYGHKDFAKKLENDFKEIIFQKRFAKKLKKEIHEMRLRVQKERGEKSSPNPLEMELKVGQGGLMDIEFLTQYLLLFHRGPAMANTRLALLHLKETKKIPPEKADILIDSYERYRHLLNRICLVCNQTIERIHPGLPRLDEIARTLAFDEAKTLIESFQETAQKVRGIYLEYLD